MKTYNDLIKRLAEASNWIIAMATESKFAHDELNALHHADTVYDAAEAIEKLQTIITLYQKATGIEIDCDLVPLKVWEKKMKDGVL